MDIQGRFRIKYDFDAQRYYLIISLILDNKEQRLVLPFDTIEPKIVSFEPISKE